uniref:Uncharacterized protein n=1 Tax=Anopheles melas TaxID=34690 RepID=A0A182UIG7_9DIPT
MSARQPQVHGQKKGTPHTYQSEGTTVHGTHQRVSNCPTCTIYARRFSYDAATGKVGDRHGHSVFRFLGACKEQEQADYLPIWHRVTVSCNEINQYIVGLFLHLLFVASVTVEQ